MISPNQVDCLLFIAEKQKNRFQVSSVLFISALPRQCTVCVYIYSTVILVAVMSAYDKETLQNKKTGEKWVFMEKEMNINMQLHLVQGIMLRMLFPLCL